MLEKILSPCVLTYRRSNINILNAPISVKVARLKLELQKVIDESTCIVVQSLNGATISSFNLTWLITCPASQRCASGRFFYMPKVLTTCD